MRANTTKCASIRVANLRAGTPHSAQAPLIDQPLRAIFRLILPSRVQGELFRTRGKRSLRNRFPHPGNMKHFTINIKQLSINSKQLHLT